MTVCLRVVTASECGPCMQGQFECIQAKYSVMLSAYSLETIADCRFSVGITISNQTMPFGPNMLSLS